MSKQGYIYYIKSGDYCKIGYSTNVERRLKTFQTGNPDLKILLVHKGSYTSESFLHIRFKHLRENGEWFKYEKELQEYIRLKKMELEALKELGYIS